MKPSYKLFGSLAIAAGIFATSESEAGTPAVMGTTANQDFSNWSEFMVGGIQNKANFSRNWLLAISGNFCGSSCLVAASWKGGALGASTAIGYAVNSSGVFTSATPLRAQPQGGPLVRQNLGTITVPSSGFVLIVANLGGASVVGGTDGGGMAMGELE